MNSKNKKGLLITVILILITAFFIFKYTNLNTLKAINEDAHKGYLFLSLGALLFFWLCDARILQMFSQMAGVPIKLRRSFNYTMIGIYYSHITPFASGGQPAQIYYMNRDQHTVGSAGSCVLSKFIVYQFTVGIYAIFMFILRAQTILHLVNNYTFFIILGLVLNILSIMLLIAIALNSKLVNTLASWIIHLLQRFGLVKSFDEARLTQEIAIFERGLQALWEHKQQTCHAFIYTVIQLSSYFSITYFIYRALGYANEPFFTIIALQAMLYMAISFIPTPGTLGAAEGGFYLLFSMCLPKDQLVYALLFWRSVTFYFSLLVSGFITLIIHLTQVRKSLMRS